MDNLTEKHNSIVEGVIWKQLLLFFFPILLGTFFQQLYNTVDAAVVGKFVGKEALAAVGGATGTLINLFVGFFVGLSWAQPSSFPNSTARKRRSPPRTRCTPPSRWASPAACC